MSKQHRIDEVDFEGFSAVALESPEPLVATWVPGAGMLGCSLRHRGQELLGQRQGLGAYARGGTTMGIPLLHPWANRLAWHGFSLDGERVEFPESAPLVHPDPNGLPIHGLLGGFAGWRVSDRSADDHAARLRAEVDLGQHSELMALFPYPHRLEMDVRLAGSTLSIHTTLTASGSRRVPVAFGYHPYFRLPDLPRAAWEVEIPVRRRMRLDEQLLPTGETEAFPRADGPLGDRTFDDLFTELEPDPVFALQGGGRRIEVAFGDRYPVAVVYAPANDDVVCFEPMTAATNPFDGDLPLSWVEPGETFEASFEIRVR